MMCNQTKYCYDDGKVGVCVDPCEDYPRLANTTCNCNSTTTCLEQDSCFPESGKCEAYSKCEDMMIMTTEHCACVEAMQACNVSEYCHAEQKACLPAPSNNCTALPDIAPTSGCSCNATIVCQEGEMCEEGDQPACIERPGACLAMPVVNTTAQCYCEEAHDLCDPGNMCNLYNNTCSLPPPKCGPIPDIATEERCVCQGAGAADADPPTPVICEEGDMCDITTGTCKPRPEPCPAMPELSEREGCYCQVNHTLCEEEQMCDNRTAIAGCTPRPPVCPPMPGVTFGVTGCYCRFSNSICEEVHMCNERNNSCSIPAMCPDPTSLQDWSSMNLEIASSYNETTLIEGSNITIMCSHNTFLTKQVQLHLQHSYDTLGITKQ